MRETSRRPVGLRPVRLRRACRWARSAGSRTPPAHRGTSRRGAQRTPHGRPPFGLRPTAGDWRSTLATETDARLGWRPNPQVRAAPGEIASRRPVLPLKPTPRLADVARELLAKNSLERRARSGVWVVGQGGCCHCEHRRGAGDQPGPAPRGGMGGGPGRAGSQRGWRRCPSRPTGEVPTAFRLRSGGRAWRRDRACGRHRRRARCPEKDGGLPWRT